MLASLDLVNVMKSKYKFQGSLLLALALSLLVGCGGGGGGASANNPSTPPVETLRNFVTAQSATAQIAGLPSMAGNPAVGPDGKLYLPTYNSIHVYNNVPNSDTSLASAAFVISHVGDSSTPIGTLDMVQTIAFSGQKMIVSDFGHNRVLIWNSVPTSDPLSWTPDVVVGQTSLTNDIANTSKFILPGCDSQSLFGAESLKVIGGNLVIADSGNNRVLIYDGIPSSHGATPKAILGDATVCANSTAANPPDASTLNYPTDVAYDGTHLVVTDSGNNRLLMWTTADVKSLTDAQAADAVLGQADFSSNTATSFSTPWSISANGTRLAVLDSVDTHDRVRIWNTAPSCTPAPCAVPLGAPTVLDVSTSFGLAFTGLNQLIVNENTSFSVFNAP